MKILDQQRQGEVLFIQVENFTDEDNQYESVKAEKGQLIVAHSETGHHHVIDVKRSKEAELLISKTNQFIGRLVVSNDVEVKHLRSFDTHKTLNLPKGKYVLRYRKEYTPEGLRKVQD
jgi:hypothetical protein